MVHLQSVQRDDPHMIYNTEPGMQFTIQRALEVCENLLTIQSLQTSKHLLIYNTERSKRLARDHRHARDRLVVN